MRGTNRPTVLFVGRDLHEAERARRLLRLEAGIAQWPSEALETRADVVLLEDHAWPAREEEALAELRARSASGRLALVLSRRRGEHGDQGGVPVVERPYRMEEVVAAVRLALLRREA
jgi:hypothetical protein